MEVYGYWAQVQRREGTEGSEAVKQFSKEITTVEGERTKKFQEIEERMCQFSLNVKNLNMVLNILTCSIE